MAMPRADAAKVEVRMIVVVRNESTGWEILRGVECRKKDSDRKKDRGNRRTGISSEFKPLQGKSLKTIEDKISL